MIRLKDILKEEKILVPRHLEDRDEDYKRIVYKKIQDYIKKGSKNNLYLYRTLIIKLPDNLTKVGGYLSLYRSQIKSLNNLQIVKGTLDLQYTPIKSLGNLQIVGKNLYLENSKIESLGNLQIVGEDLGLGNTPLSKKYSKEEILQILKDKGIKVKGNIYT